jgi:hypothetical protein
MLDLGLEPRAIGLLGVVLMAPSFVAVVGEAALRKSGSLQTLPERCVEYVGRGARRSPRASDQSQR